MEEFHTKPIEERKSRHLGVIDYIKGNAWAFLPAASAVFGIAVGALTKQKVFPFDGSPMILQKLQEKLISKGSAKVLGTEIEKITDHERLWFIPERYRMQAAPHFWNGMKAMEFSALPALYMAWRHKEGQTLDLKDVSQKLLTLDNLKPSDEELTTENASLRQQLAFVREHKTPSVDEKLPTRLHAAQIERLGTVSSAEPTMAK